MTKRIIYAGTPDFAVPTLAALIANACAFDYEIVAVYTQPDRPAGRGRKLQASPIKELACIHQLPIIQIENFHDQQALDELKNLNADLMLVAAYGLLLPPVVLAAPKLGCVNLHASKLPRWRGAAPIARAIQAGDEVTGITLMQMAKGLDTGDMLVQTDCLIGTHSAQSLHDKLANDAAELLISHLPALLAGELAAKAQDDNAATYAAKLNKSEGVLDWHQSATALLRQIKALNPYPICYTQLENGSILRIHDAALAAQSNSGKAAGTVLECSRQAILVQTGDGVLALLELQLAGRQKLTAAQFANGIDLNAQLLASR